MYADAITAFISQLQKQLGLLQQLREASQQKQSALVKCRMDLLQPLSEQEQELAAQVAQCEQRRIELLGQMQECGLLDERLIPEEVTLTALRELLPLEHLGPLASLSDALIETSSAVHELNLQNEELTLNLMDYTASVLRLLTQDGAPSAYSAEGLVTAAQNRSLLDSRV